MRATGTWMSRPAHAEGPPEDNVRHIMVVSALPHIRHSLRVLEMLSKSTASDAAINISLQIEQTLQLLNTLKASISAASSDTSSEDEGVTVTCTDDNGTGIDD